MPQLYDLTIPVFIRALENMNAFLKKGEKWAKENNVPIEKLVEGSIAEDMKPLPFQIQSCSNAAKFVAVRIGGVENQSMDDTETTLPQLYERIDKTIAFLKSVKPDGFEGKESIEIELPRGYKFKGLEYLQTFAIPNFFFHESMAYAILRKAGAPVGKMDYLGWT